MPVDRSSRAQAILRVLVDSYGIPVEAIAARMGISGAKVSGWRTGRRPPGREHLEQLEELLLSGERLRG